MPVPRRVEAEPQQEQQGKRTKEKWAGFFRQKGVESRAKAEPVLFDTVDLTNLPAAIASYLERHPKQAKELAKRGIDATFVGGGMLVAAELRTLEAQQPPDKRRQSVLTPADKKAIEKEAQLYGDLKDSATAAAKALGRMDDMHKLGRGIDFNLKSASGVAEAVQHFLSGVADCREILDEAAIGEADLEELRGGAERLFHIQGSRDVRGSEKRERSVESTVLHLALETFADLYRARARMGLRADPESLAQALSILPRRKDRRRAASAPEGEGDASKGEGEAAKDGAPAKNGDSPAPEK